MSRRVMLVLVVGAWLSATTSCTLARDVTSTSDAGVVATDAVVIPGVDAYVAPGLDAFVEPIDAYVAPGVDAYVAPRDAFVAPDAYVAPIDAYVAPDAYTPETCMVRYGTIRGSYSECEMTATTCTFYAALSSSSCDTVCMAGGGTCLTASDNAGAPNQCTAFGTSASTQCATGRGDGICTCTRP